MIGPRCGDLDRTRLAHETAPGAPGAVVHRRARRAGGSAPSDARRRSGVRWAARRDAGSECGVGGAGDGGHQRDGSRVPFELQGARHEGVEELLSEFSLARVARARRVQGSATVAAYARDNLLEKRRPVMQRWADTIGGYRRLGAPSAYAVSGEPWRQASKAQGRCSTGTSGRGLGRLAGPCP